MIARSVNNLPLERCKHCGREFIRAKSWEYYCRRPECQRAYNSDVYQDERSREKRGRQVIHLDEVPSEYGGYRKA